jgi:hypothetical protein
VLIIETSQKTTNDKFALIMVFLASFLGFYNSNDFKILGFQDFERLKILGFHHF